MNNYVTSRLLHKPLCFYTHHTKICMLLGELEDSLVEDADGKVVGIIDGNVVGWKVGCIP